MGADYYESEEQKAALLAAGGVPVGIGENSTIANAVRLGGGVWWMWRRVCMRTGVCGSTWCGT